MALRFDGRVAIVTGAGNGLGRAYALLLAARGARVVVNDLGGSFKGEGASSRAADLVVEEIRRAGGQAVPNYDSAENGRALVATALSNFQRLDIIVCNAGILRDKSFLKMSDEDWDLVMRVHLRGAYALCHAAFPVMREQGFGRVVCVTSAAGLYGNVGQANYAAAKMAVVGLAATLAKEGASKGKPRAIESPHFSLALALPPRQNICVNTVAPLAGSRMTETVMPADLVAALRPEFVAAVVAVLAHEQTTTSGAVIECGAGWAAAVRRERAGGWSAPAAALTPELLRANLDKAKDFGAPSYPSSPAESTATIVAELGRHRAKL